MPPRFSQPTVFYTATLNLGQNQRGEIRTIQTFDTSPDVIVINGKKPSDPVEKQQVITLTWDELETIYRSVGAARRD